MAETLPEKTDGPSVQILEFMKTFEYNAPKDWLGWRGLPER
jgi:hypothetical protein